MTTFSGKTVDPLNLLPEDICIEDIAHHLALVNRFGGATRRPLSVAQHSVYVARLCEEHGASVALQGLLHDASEAYLGDVIKWLKESSAMLAYRKAEEQAQETIMEMFNLPSTLHSAVEEADRLICRYEADRLMPSLAAPATQRHRYMPITPEERKRVGPWAPWSWKISKDIFLFTFSYLVAERTENS